MLDCPDRSASWTDSPLFIWEADDVLNASIAAGTIPGAVLSVIKGGQTVYMKAYGNKSVTPSVVPMTLDVVFDMASVTKSVSTTISMMQLVEKGLVDVKATIGTYLSEFDPAEDITVENLLAHNSGFPNYQGYIKAADYAGRPDLLVAYIADSHPRLSKIYRYSCLNFFLCQQIIERVTGQRLCDYAKEHIFQPLGLDDTMYLPAGEEIPEAYKARIAPQLSGSSIRIGKCIDDVAWTVCGGNAGNAGGGANAGAGANNANGGTAIGDNATPRAGAPNVVDLDNGDVPQAQLPEDEASELDIQHLLGIILGGAGLLALIAALVIALIKRRNAEYEDDDEDEEDDGDEE